MKAVPVLLTCLAGLSAGCNQDSSSSGGAPADSAIGLCPSSGGGGDEDFVHVDQADLLARVKAGRIDEVFDFTFEKGDILFGRSFTKGEGSGANVGGDALSAYTRMPRADLNGPGQWVTHRPSRATGPNAQSCKECHNEPVEDGAGTTVANVHRDPKHTKDPNQMIQRNTPHLFGMGAVQRLAEEMTTDLRKQIEPGSCKPGEVAVRKLMTKGVDFGEVHLTCASGRFVVDREKSTIEGVDPDLVVRPFQWKKSVAFVRDFMRDAGHNEIGMQGAEIVGLGQDGDGDGKVDELTVGDMTAFTVYMAAQVRPTTKTELADFGLIDLPSFDRKQIERGRQLFEGQLGCAVCHKPNLVLSDPVFREPSQSPWHRDKRKADGSPLPVDLLDQGVDPAHPIQFDLTRDIPDNVFCRAGKEIRLGAFEGNKGNVRVALYGDLKRHYMGDALAEPIDETGTGHMGMVPYEPVDALVTYKHTEEEGRSTFGTKELWGVGCTGPWLHDGRATTLTEAILLHGGEAQEARDAFAGLGDGARKDLIAFLGNLVVYLKKAGDTEIPRLPEACSISE